MSNIIWSATKGWHDGPEVDNADLVKVFVRPSRKRADIAATIHAAAMRKDKK